MAKSRQAMRREVEAAEAAEVAKPAAKKKATKKKAAKKKTTRKKKSDVPARRRLVWVLYSSTMREEGRYLYHEREKAEEKLNALLAKGKRRYFLQPIKEPLDAEGNPMVPDDDDMKGETVKAEKADAEEKADEKADDAETETETETEAEPAAE